VCLELNFKDEEEFEKYRNLSVRAGVILTFFLIIEFPLPMYFSNFVFDKPFFNFWVVVAFVWSATYHTLAHTLGHTFART
jgi:hypothetical protein